MKKFQTVKAKELDKRNEVLHPISDELVAIERDSIKVEVPILLNYKDKFPLVVEFFKSRFYTPDNKELPTIDEYFTFDNNSLPVPNFFEDAIADNIKKAIEQRLNDVGLDVKELNNNNAEQTFALLEQTFKEPIVEHEYTSMLKKIMIQPSTDLHPIAGLELVKNSGDVNIEVIAKHLDNLLVYGKSDIVVSALPTLRKIENYQKQITKGDKAAVLAEFENITRDLPLDKNIDEIKDAIREAISSYAPHPELKREELISKAKEVATEIKEKAKEAAREFKEVEIELEKKQPKKDFGLSFGM